MVYDARIDTQITYGSLYNLCVPWFFLYAAAHSFLKNDLGSATFYFVSGITHLATGIFQLAFPRYSRENNNRLGVALNLIFGASEFFSPYNSEILKLGGAAHFVGLAVNAIEAAIYNKIKKIEH